MKPQDFTAAQLASFGYVEMQHRHVTKRGDDLVLYYSFRANEDSPCPDNITFSVRIKPDGTINTNAYEQGWDNGATIGVVEIKP